MDQDLPSLLNKIGLILQRQADKAPVGSSFNIFSLLRPSHDEVALHSRFLFELLNPKGSHGVGDVFLRAFARHCGFEIHINSVELNYKRVRVRREHKKIDLLIDDGHHAVIIENKIYAPDQPQQLERYHAKALNESWKPTLYYLTLDGHEPSDYSLGKLPSEQVQSISYAVQVEAWLTECIQHAALLPGLRETLVQYQKLLQKLTGTSMSEARKPFINLLEQGKNGLEAGFIVNNWPHVRHHVEFQFWTELTALVEQQYEVSSAAAFTAERIHRAINNTRNRDTGYGIRATIGKLDGVEMQFKINRGESVYYGLPRPKTGIAEHLQAKLNQIFLTPQNDFWLIGESSNPSINFGGFKDEFTLQLINPANRTAAISQLWSSIGLLIDSSINRLSDAFPNDFIAAKRP